MRRENVKGGNEDLGVFKMYFKTFIYGRKQMVLDKSVELYVYMCVCVSMFINS